VTSQEMGGVIGELTLVESSFGAFFRNLGGTDQS
jgi:hypothetical protein